MQGRLGKDINIISFTGTGGTGKSTLAKELNKLYPSIRLITNLTRKVDRDERLSKEGQDAILRNYLTELTKAAPLGFVCDRTLYDVCSYSLVSGAWNKKKVDTVLTQYKRCSFYPDFIFYLPIEFEQVVGEDKDRDRFFEIRKEMDDTLKALLGIYAPVYHTLTGSVEERIKQIEGIVG